jgi:hypothetical protein
VSISTAINDINDNNSNIDNSTSNQGATVMDCSPPSTTAVPIKLLTPFQTRRLTLISQLRELVINGRDTDTIQHELGINQRQYYRLLQKAFEPEHKRLDEWNRQILQQQCATMIARLEKLLQFYMDMVNNQEASEIARLKAAQLATELTPLIYKTQQYEVQSALRSQKYEDNKKEEAEFPPWSDYHNPEQFKKRYKKFIAERKEEAKIKEHLRKWIKREENRKA